METSPTSVGGSRIDLLVGGTPCQAFSVSGLRGGLADARGNLALAFCQLADQLRPRWVLWENVPGVLSSNGGRDFGSILGALVNIGYGFAYRVLDAQFYGVPQRRRRVFLVGYLGDWRRAAAVLFDRESLRGNPKKGRKARQEVARTLGAGPSSNVERRTLAYQSTAHPLLAGANDKQDPTRVTYAVSVTGQVAHTLRAEGCDASEDGTGRGTPVIAHCVAAHAAKGGDPTTDNYTVQGARVRRLTPRECERLQGFPDDYTLVPYSKTRGLYMGMAADGQRYKAVGNSMAVPVMHSLGERIEAVDALEAA